MKKILVHLFSVTLLFISCKDNKGGPDVSSIKVDVGMQRFDKDFFAIDSNSMATALPDLQKKYPVFLPIFINNVLGLGPLETSNSAAFEGAKHFLHLTQPLYDTVALVFQNVDGLQKDFEEAFRYVKNYFPAYKAPVKVITLVGPMDGLASLGSELTPDFIGPDFLGISLQFYLGKNFSAYNDEYFINRVAPQYRSRRFEKNYIVPDAMKLIVDDLFPDRTQGKPLIEQLIEKGKQWWLLDQFLPRTADSLKTGYTQSQLEWCKVNEGLIWNYIVTNENIYAVDPATIQQYIGEAPFTQTMSEASPGNIGPWIGWQIVKKYAQNSKTSSPEEIMKADAKKILEEAKYKPK